MNLLAVPPFGWSGTIEMPTWSNSQQGILDASEALESALLEESPRSVMRSGVVVQFRGGLFRMVWNWNILVPITSGRLEVIPTMKGVRVHYQIKFTEILLIATLFAAILAAFPKNPYLPYRVDLTVFLLAWSWLFGANAAIAVIRFPLFLKRSLRNAQHAA